jgi:hypothetical protein
MQTDKKEEPNVQKLYFSTSEYYHEINESYTTFLNYYDNSIDCNININEIQHQISLIENNKKKLRDSKHYLYIAFSSILGKFTQNLKASENYLNEIRSKLRLLVQYTHSLKKNKSRCNKLIT